jgi:cysteine desulfurase family protein (TIGR01976 family)
MTTLDIDRIRAQFPAIAQNTGPDAPVFFDNPGGTQVPQMVIDAITDCLINANSNLGGQFKTTQAAGDVVDQAHEAMADFVNAGSAQEIIFGQNMTTLTFHISRSIGNLFSQGDEIILTRMEHDANISPWLLMARDRGLVVKWLPFDTDTYEFDLDKLDGLLSERTKLVCFNHASNLTGTINDVKTVTEKAHAVGALVYVDSVQYAPHGIVDVQDLGCDFLVCSPYKFFGPHMGVLWGKLDVLKTLEAYKVRPATDQLPGCFETGTLSHESMAGVTATVEYFAQAGRDFADPHYRTRYAGAGNERRQMICAGMHALSDYELPLTRRLIEGLQGLPGVTVRGITSSNALARRVPTISFTAEGHKPVDITAKLAKHSIYVWDGHNYAIEPVNEMGLMDKGGVVRVGLAHYNTMAEVERTIDVLAEHLNA